MLRWFKIRMREKSLNDVLPVTKWLEECSQRMYLAFQDSNFDSEIQEVYMDLHHRIWVLELGPVYTRVTGPIDEQVFGRADDAVQ